MPGEAELRRRFEAAIELGLQFRDARVARGWSQRELSEQSGVRQADISRIERGAGNPPKPRCTVWPAPLKSASNSYDRKAPDRFRARPQARPGAIIRGSPGSVVTGREGTWLVRLPHGRLKTPASFDDLNLVRRAGLVPVMGLGERAGLSA